MTKFGIFIRKFRLDKGIFLRDMAKDLDISPAYLSAMETGHKDITQSLADKISSVYNLSIEQTKELKKSIVLSQQKICITTGQIVWKNEIVSMLKEKLDNLSEEQRLKIIEVLKE
jgi:transcriptional regulator with XRE-family HTH domain